MLCLEVKIVISSNYLISISRFCPVVSFEHFLELIHLDQYQSFQTRLCSFLLNFHNKVMDRDNRKLSYCLGLLTFHFLVPLVPVVKSVMAG